jgi:hypothetical protein
LLSPSSGESDVSSVILSGYTRRKHWTRRKWTCSVIVIIEMTSCFGTIYCCPSKIRRHFIVHINCYRVCCMDAMGILLLWLAMQILLCVLFIDPSCHWMLARQMVLWNFLSENRGLC